MEAVRIPEVGAWRDAAAPVLLADEARHNLLFGIADTLARHPGRYPAFDLWLVRDGDAPVAAALRTPPFNLLLARPLHDGAIATLAEAIAAAGDRPPGVTAAEPEAGSFARAWHERTGAVVRPVMGQGVYELRRVIEPAPVPGAPRRATAADRPLLRRWVQEFSDEALTHRPLTADQVEASVEQRLRGGPEGFAIWEDEGRPVSLCGWGGVTPTGIRIGPVYTPPADRGRGYATALVARVSADRLAEGRAACFLYTDLGNPTSNAVYRRIGYSQVCESIELAFDDPATS